MPEIIEDLSAFLRSTLTILDEVNAKNAPNLLGGAIVSALVDIANSQRRQAKAQEDIAAVLMFWQDRERSNNG